MPLRRDDISKKVMGAQRGTFKAVFDEAQKILRATFGMELVELPTRAATHDTATADSGTTGRDRTQQEKAGTQNGDEGAGDRQAVTGLKKKGAISLALALPQMHAFILLCPYSPSSRLAGFQDVYPSLDTGSCAD